MRLFSSINSKAHQTLWITISGIAGVLLFVFSTFAQQTPPGIEQKATEEIQSGEFQTAAKLLRKSLENQPRNVELWNLLGIAATELRDERAAKNAFQRGLQLAPNSVSLHENLGFLYYRNADYMNARTYLEQAVKLGSKKPGVLFSLAASKLRTGAQAEAISELKSLEPALATSPDYWNERGRAELSGDPAGAEESFEHSLRIAPKDLTALNGAAAAAEKQGLYEKALAYLIKARTFAPDDVPTLIHFGSVCIRRDLGQDAVDALAKVHSLEPSNNSALYLLARANISLENWQRSYDLFDQFAKRVPAFAATYYAMGWLDIKLNRLDDAKRQLEHCLSLAPDMQDARYELAKLELDDGEFDSAENLLKTILKARPEHAKANMTMGDLMMRRGNFAQAKAYLETAVQKDPKLAAAHYKLSTLFFREHNPEQGERERTIAVNLNAAANRASKTELRLVLPEAAVEQ